MNKQDFRNAFANAKTPADRRQILKQAALSGLWKPGRGYLISGRRHCFLGVACDLTGLGEFKFEMIGNISGCYMINNENHLKLIPNQVAQLYEFDRELEHFHYKKSAQNEISLANDSAEPKKEYEAAIEEMERIFG